MAPRRWRLAILATTVAIIVSACSGGASPSPSASGDTGSASPSAGEKETINVLAMAQAGLTPDEMNSVIAEFTEKNPNITVVPQYLAYDALHDKIATSMAASTAPYDVVPVDDIWFAEFAAAGWLEDITAKIPPDMKADSDKSSWDVVTVDGKSYGLPWLVDQLYFYYNADMLQQAGIAAPPTTWEEMMDQAKILKEKGLVEYPAVFSWAQIEASICNFVTFLYGNDGAFFDESGKPVFNSPAAVEMLSWWRDALKSGLVNPASTTYAEEDLRNTMSAGKAAFTINWAYMLDLANDPKESQVAGKIKIDTIPVFAKAKAKGIESSSNNGSMGFGVTSTSAHKDAAFKFIEYLTSKDVQKRYAAHVTPLWTSLLSDPELLAKQPDLLGAFAKQWPWAHVRPKVPYYLEMSQTLQVAIADVLVNGADPKTALDGAAQKATELAAQ